jgi:hypothetical protein
MNLEKIICQVWVALFGGAAIWLVGRRERWGRWGFICGLLSQPAWLYTSVKHGQWGVVALSIWYTYAWLQGIYNYWIRSKRDGQAADR